MQRRRRSLKLDPLGRPKATASAAQAPPPPLPVDQKDHLYQVARPPPRQPGHNSTAACASVGRHVSQPEGKTAQRRALLHGTTLTARAQKHGGVRFYRAAMAPRQQLPLLAQQHVGTCFCRSGHDSQGTAARRRALLLGATLARATQHGRVCFQRARTSSARGHNSTAACASTWRHVNSQSAAARGRSLLWLGWAYLTKKV